MNDPPTQGPNDHCRLTPFREREDKPFDTRIFNFTPSKAPYGWKDGNLSNMPQFLWYGENVSDQEDERDQEKRVFNIASFVDEVDKVGNLHGICCCVSRYRGGNQTW